MENRNSHFEWLHAHQMKPAQPQKSFITITNELIVCAGAEHESVDPLSDALQREHQQYSEWIVSLHSLF